jgi:hypothetical protein
MYQALISIAIRIAIDAEFEPGGRNREMGVKNKKKNATDSTDFTD